MVRHDITGFVAENDEQFLGRMLEFTGQPERLRVMGEAARENIREKFWVTAFEMTYNAYRFCHQSAAASHEFDRKPVLAPADNKHNKEQHKQLRD